jgi:hypothetical protein
MWSISKPKLEEYFQDKNIKEISGNPAYSLIIALTVDGVVHQRSSK